MLSNRYAAQHADDLENFQFLIKCVIAISAAIVVAIFLIALFSQPALIIVPAMHLTGAAPALSLLPALAIALCLGAFFMLAARPFSYGQHASVNTRWFDNNWWAYTPSTQPYKHNVTLHSDSSSWSSPHKTHGHNHNHNHGVFFPTQNHSHHHGHTPTVTHHEPTHHYVTPTTHGHGHG